MMNRRRFKQQTPKLTSLILIPIIALAILGITYSHWQETLRITGTVTIGEWHQSIGSDKVVKPVRYDENRSITDQIIDDAQTLQLTCANISDGWHIWAGLVIHNDGTVPTSTEEPTIQFTGTNSYEQNFNITTYFYGPYDDGDFTEVWAGHINMTNLPFTPWKESGITLNPGQTTVIWIEFKFNCTDPQLVVDPVEIRITIQYELDVQP